VALLRKTLPQKSNLQAADESSVIGFYIELFPMNKIALFSIVCTLLVSSCTQLDQSSQIRTADLANITDSILEVSNTNVVFFEVTHVNGKLVDSSSIKTRGRSFKLGFKMRPAALNRDVPSGSQVLNVCLFNYYAADLFGVSHVKCTAQGVIKAALQPGVGYAVNGISSDQYSLIWLEEVKTGVIISNIIQKGAVTQSEIENIKLQKAMAATEKSRAAADEKLKLANALDNALGGYNHGICSDSKLNNATLIYEVAETLFKNKEYKKSLECFLTVSEVENLPKERFQYISLLYELGIQVEQNKEKADYWEKRFEGK
jgi:hypothetical protein